MTFTFGEVLQIALYFINELMGFMVLPIGLTFGSWLLLIIVKAVGESLP